MIRMENKGRIVVQEETSPNFESDDLTTIVDDLNALITANRGLENIYQTAAERLDDETYAELVEDIAKQHETFILELSNLVVSRGGDPETNASSGSLLKQAWVNLKAAVTDGDGPIMAELVQDIENVLDAYEERMTSDLPHDMDELLSRQVHELRKIHEKLSGVSTVLNSLKK